MSHIIIEDAGNSLNPDLLREKLDTVDCGSIVSFIGITRGVEEGSKVIHLEFDAWIEKLPTVLPVSYTHLRAHET